MNDRPAAHSARKTKHKTPQLQCSSSTVFFSPPCQKCLQFRLRRAAWADVELAHPPNCLGPGSLPSYTDHLDLKTLCPGSRLMVLYAEYGGVWGDVGGESRTVVLRRSGRVIGSRECDGFPIPVGQRALAFSELSGSGHYEWLSVRK